MIAPRLSMSTARVLGAVMLLSWSWVHAGEELPHLRVYGNTSTIELAPVLLASDRVYQGSSSVSMGGIPNLFAEGEADIATNAETQALRQSVDHPDLRIIFTVSEGFYRILARRSAGIARLEDLRGKRIATVPRTSSAYYLHRMLATVGLTEDDVTVVPMFPLDRVPPAIKQGEIDAVTVWEPEIQNAADLLGKDAIEFQDRSVYRELFNLHATAETLADPVRRCAVVAYVRSLIEASKRVRENPQEVRPLVAKSTGFSEKLIAKVWHHEGYPGTLVADVLDVLADEEIWVAKERDRTPRTREQLAALIDASVLEDARAKDSGKCEAGIAAARQKLGGDLGEIQRSVAHLAESVRRAEALRSVKRLQHAYAQYFNAGQWDDIASLFSTDGVARNGNSAVSGADNLRKHFTEQFGDGKQGLIDGRLQSVLFLSPVVTLDRDGRTARARWHAVNMQGTYGSKAEWAGGIYENEYVEADGIWKIRHEHYYPQYAGAYQQGWRNLASETSPTRPVPYHYDPTRAGMPIPPQLPAAESELASFEALTEEVAALRYRAKQLNESSIVGNLQNAYGYYVDRKMWDDVADMFTTRGTLQMGNQGVYAGRASIRHALEQLGPQGLRQGQVNDHLQLNTIVTVAPDGNSAEVRGTQLRMTGENGKQAQWGLDVFKNTYVKELGGWRIQSVRIYPRLTTDYYQGWGRSALPAPGPSKEFPPDRQAPARYQSYPKAQAVPVDFELPLVAAATPEVLEALRPRTLAELQSAIEAAELRVAVAEAYDGAENVANAYGYYIDEFLWYDTADLFSLNGSKELSYIGTYVGRDRVRESMIRRYGLAGRRANFLAIHQKTQPVVHVAPDGQSARIRTRLFQINSQLEGDGSYIAGIYENRVVKENGVWKISSMDLDYTWTTSYTSGWGKVNAEDSRRFAPTPALAKEYPPDGPLRGVTYAPFPEIAETAFHYRNPVSGRAPPLLLP